MSKSNSKVVNLKTKINTTYSQYKQPLAIANEEYDSNKRYSSINRVSSFIMPEKIAQIDRVLTSQYKYESKDNNGNKKIYLNKSLFTLEVNKVKTDIKIDDIKFKSVDASPNVEVQSLLVTRQFHNWVKDVNNKYNFQQLLWDWQDCWREYGTLVVRNIKGVIEAIDIHNLIVPAGEESLEKIIENDKAIIIEHDYSYSDLLEQADWNKKDIEPFSGTIKIREIYTRLPMEYINKLAEPDTGRDSNIDYELKRDEKWELAFIIQINTTKITTTDKDILYIQQIDELPLVLQKYKNIPGRFLGEGVVEKSIPDQEIANEIINLKIKAMRKATRTIFQAERTDNLPRNLLSELPDGAVIEVGQGGEMRVVDTSNRGLSDMNSLDKDINEHIKQNGWTFDAVTGQSLPAGTPFRLGSLVTEAASSYFNSKKGQFAVFLAKYIEDNVYGIFRANYKKDVEIIGSTDNGFYLLQDFVLSYNVSKYYIQRLLDGTFISLEAIPDIEDVRAVLAEELSSKKSIIIDGIRDLYKNTKYKIDIVIGSYSKGYASQEALKDIYSETIATGQYENADAVLEKIFNNEGISYKNINGSRFRKQQEQQQAQQQQTANPNPTNSPILKESKEKPSAVAQ